MAGLARRQSSEYLDAARLAAMRILVTGANGFVGRNLCLALCRQEHAVVAAVRS